MRPDIVEEFAVAVRQARENLRRVNECVAVETCHVQALADATASLHAALCAYYTVAEDVRTGGLS